ncbi:hypothetical protein QVD17_17020 [Tagetes erecta]|uniref:Rapid ALkalinization Factor n=1 Tax=Tagetes erecta TaxID=13708 RepID=A0AAD8P123_TARER|nr:hypothetical protein QVD17_17020 [Tagetes erecta]
MTTSTNLLLLLLFISFMFLHPASAGLTDINWMSNSGACTGSIAECLGGEEFVMESESTRRILATTRYISYGALQGNNVPCSQRGASYYNCQSGGQANPYQRGCSTITRCRR